jgi:hypothetical protein
MRVITTRIKPPIKEIDSLWIGGTFGRFLARFGEKMVLTAGVHLSVERERGERGKGELGWGRLGWFLPGLARPVWAPDRPKWAGLFLSSFCFVLIHFLFSVFLFSFIDFAYWVQTRSNHFLNFYKNQHNV